MRHRLAALSACALLLFSCVDLSVDPEAIGSILFDPPAYPTVDQGDTLRDTAGKVARLRSRVFLADGKEVTNVPVRFLLRRNDSGLVTISDSGLVRSTRLLGTQASDSAIVVIDVNGLQSQARSIVVVRRPDSVFTAPGDTVVAAAPGDTTPQLVVKLVTRGANSVGVPGQVVRFSLQRRDGTPFPSPDTLAMWYLVDGTRFKTVDTTDAKGQASLKVRFRRTPGGSAESIVVVAKVLRSDSIMRIPRRWVVNSSR